MEILCKIQVILNPYFAGLGVKISLGSTRIFIQNLFYLVKNRSQNLRLFYIFYFYDKMKKKNFGVEVIFSKGEFCLEEVGPFLEMVTNLPRAYEKFYYKGKSYRSSD